MDTPDFRSTARWPSSPEPAKACANGTRDLFATGTPPTAIMAPNDLAAIGVLEVLDAMGHDVPRDVSVTGYDNTLLARIGRIDLTTIEQPMVDLGRTAVSLLLERIEDGRTEARHVVLPPRLVVGSTTGPSGDRNG